MDVIIISGMSGAGKSRVAAILEDMDFYCVDNMPVAMMPKFAELCLAARGQYEHVALVTDVRALGDIGELFRALDDMRELGCGHRILFVEADVETIVKRYKESRRKHPLVTKGRSLEEAVRRELEVLTPLREQADEIIDTSGRTLSSLQQHIFSRIIDNQDVKTLNVNIKSFGFKYGLPIEADLVFDVRFMPNPYYIKELHDKTGLEESVREYVFSQEQTGGFFERLCDMLDFLIPHYIREGKRYLVVCIGCTGGRHRSVAVAQALTERVTASGYPVDCVHRDIEKG